MVGAKKSQPEFDENRFFTLPVLMYWLIFAYHANFDFTAIYGFNGCFFTALQLIMTSWLFSCNLMVTFMDMHWVELIQPQRWAGILACPPQR